MKNNQTNKIKILHLEDLAYDAELVERALVKGGIDFEKIVVDNKLDFENALDNFLPDIILSDHSLPSFDSIQALKIVKEKSVDVPFILITSAMTDELAVNIMQEGANDYIIKDRLNRLPAAVLNALEKFRLEKEKQKFLDQIAANEMRFRALIEKSTDMKMLTTPEGKFIYSSPSVTKVFGYSTEEFFHKPASDFIHPDYIFNLIKNRILLLKKSGATFSFQYHLLHKNGSWLWCEGTITNLLHEPGVNAFVANFRDITERKKTEEEIFDKNIQLKSLLRIAQTIREEERKNVAREIHDELGQQLTALKMDIDWILRKQNNPDIQVVTKLKEMLNMNDQIINTVRRISSDLRPAIIDDLGLIATIEWMCGDFEEKSEIKCDFISSVKEKKYSKDFSINVYRILQEALTNIIRHAGASYVTVLLTENEQALTIEIKDNGKGIKKDAIENSKRLGLLGMKERVEMLNGELIITGNTGIGNAGKGTCVKLILPLENEYINSLMTMI